MNRSLNKLPVLSLLLFQLTMLAPLDVASAADIKDGPAGAGQPAPDLPMKSVTPIYSQLLYMGYPAGFKTVSEKVAPQRYMREAVLAGETVEQWSQMITVTGVKDTAADTAVSPADYAEHIVNGFRQVCPDSFSQKKLSEGIVNGYEQYIVVTGCGQSATGRTSESAMVIVIKGERDYYTVQWAERGEASKTPMAINMAKWIGRHKQLAPIRLCARVPDEQTPYPSCVNAP